MSLMLPSGAVAVVIAIAVIAVLIAIIVRLRRRETDWAGERRPPAPPDQPPTPPERPGTIDSSDQFREQHRPTDPPPPA